MVGNPAALPAALDGLKNVAPVLVPVAKLLVAFPFCYHSAGTIRHLIWDKTAKGLDLKSVHLSSYAVIAVSVIGAVGLAAYEID